MASEYVCTLDDKSLAIAQKELKEDPKNRLVALDTVRTWINQQPHFSCPTDTPFLLPFLRTAKFSQLKARDKVEGYTRAICKDASDWIADIDTADTKFQAFLETGTILALPLKDYEGRAVIFWRSGGMEWKYENKTPMMRAGVAVLLYLLLDENNHVRGINYVMDMSHFTLKALTLWTPDDMKRENFLFQKCLPGRYKAFNCYNPGPIIDTLISTMRPFYPKKVMDRLFIHNTMEDVYKVIPMEALPSEYLPDDYAGPSAGSVQDILDRFKKDISAPAMRQRILDITSSRNFQYDEKKKDKDAPVASFLKLNVD